MRRPINFNKILKVIRKRAIAITFFVILTGSVTAIINYFILTPIYEARTEILVYKTETDSKVLSYSEIQSNMLLINTYNRIIKSPVILDTVSKNKVLHTTTEELQKIISVESDRESQIIDLLVIDKDPIRAANISNAAAQVFKEKIVDIMKIDNVTILSKAKIEGPHKIIKPQKLVNTTLSVLISFFVGMGLAMSYENIHKAIKEENDFESELGISKFSDLKS